MKVITKLVIGIGVFLMTIQANAQEVTVTEKTAIAPLSETLTLDGVGDVKKHCAKDCKKACCAIKQTGEASTSTSNEGAVIGGDIKKSCKKKCKKACCAAKVGAEVEGAKKKSCKKSCKKKKEKAV